MLAPFTSLAEECGQTTKSQEPKGPRGCPGIDMRSIKELLVT